MLPGATVKWKVAPVVSFLPVALVTPASPAGTVTVSVADGTSGAVATKAKVSGVTNCQVPATAGLSDGVGEWALSGLGELHGDRGIAGHLGASRWRGSAPPRGTDRLEVRPSSWAGDVVGDAAARPASPRTATAATPTRDHGDQRQGDGEQPSPVSAGGCFWARSPVLRVCSSHISPHQGIYQPAARICRHRGSVRTGGRPSSAQPGACSATRAPMVASTFSIGSGIGDLVAVGPRT